jgi:class 3 adenylate cyclase/tetratricopeptide (TPR) repeat protein
MTFEEILDQAIAMLQRRGRLTYGALKRQFQLDDAYLDDLKAELIEGQRLAADEDGRVLVWIGAEVSAPDSTAPPVSSQDRLPLAYTPPYLAEKILTSKSTLEGERKQITVLFTDLKGSMELLADRDPEEARQLLDPVLERMMAAVHRYEGTVNQVMGDGIMALFGAPIAHEDHAVRACYAALAMQAAVKQYAAEVQRTKGVPLQIRVGLNAGEVVVRAIGNDLHMDYTAVGQTTHLAARMEQMAMPGSILLPAATLRLVEGFVQVKGLGSVPIKGLTEPVEVFELVGASALRSRFQARVAGGLTRFVGRDQEMATVQHALTLAGAGQGQVVATVGEAGVGKSRFVYEFAHSHHTPGWRVLESASVSYGKATPYVPVIDLLKRYAQVDDHDDTRTVRAKVTGQVLTLDETLQETLPALLSLVEALPEHHPFLQLDPPQRRQQTLEALKRLLLRESQVQPVVLVFEDLHWIDAETQALLDSLVESLPAARLLLLVNYRPEYQHGWGSKTYYTQLRLDPLLPASADALLHALLGNDPSLEPLKRLLVARTEGNPFFLEENVRTLVEGGVLVGGPGAYRLALPLETFQVPATVQAVLAARIDRLPPEEKRLLQTAAVIGHDVPLSLVQAIAELPEADFHRGLTHLQAAEFLYETRLFPEREYTFKHALTHEVAYGSLLQERRRTLHAQIVQALEALYADRLTDHVERLAHHALQGEVWDKAQAYFWQAGTKAASRSAHREAVTCFEQARNALHHLPESRDTLEQAIDLRFELRNALVPLGALKRIHDYLREAEALAVALDDPMRLSQVLCYLTNYFWVMGDPERAIASGQRALTLDNSTIKVLTSLFLAQAYCTMGDYHRAIELLRGNVAALAADPISEHSGRMVMASAFSRTWLVWCLAECGEFAEAIACGETGLQLAEAVDHPYNLSSAYFGVGLLYLRKGELHKAILVLERGLQLCQIRDLPIRFSSIASALGYAYGLSGRIGEAIPLLETGVEQATSLGRVDNHALWAAWLSEVYMLDAQMEKAIHLARRAHDLSLQHKERGHQAYVLRLLGEIAYRRAPPEIEHAEASYRQALAMATEHGMRPLMAHCYLGLGALSHQEGRSEQASSELSTAVELYRAMDMTFWLPQAEAALAQVEGH